MGQRIATHGAAATATAILAALLLFALPGRAAAYQVGPSNCPHASSLLGTMGPHTLDRTVKCMLNEQRTRRGLRALRSNSRLHAPARYHNWDLIFNLGFLSHNSSNGESAVQRILRYGYTSGTRSWTVGEIIAYAWGVFKTPRSIVGGWLNSPPHRTILLMSKWHDFGVAGRRGVPGNTLAFGAVYTVDFGWRSW